MLDLTFYEGDPESQINPMTLGVLSYPNYVKFSITASHKRRSEIRISRSDFAQLCQEGHNDVFVNDLSNRLERNFATIIARHLALDDRN